MSILLAGVVLAFGPRAATLDILVDSDNNGSTGCNIATATASITGVEFVITTSVNTSVSPPIVTGVVRADCNATDHALGPNVAFDPGGWPVGVGNGTSGYDVLETYFPVTSTSGQYRMAFIYTEPAIGSDTVLTATGQTGAAAILLSLGPVPIVPTLAHSLLMLLAVALGCVALVSLRARRMPMMIVVGSLAMIVAGTVVAAVILNGLIDDWTDTPPLAMDPAGDAPAGADIAAIFAKLEGVKLYVRADVKTLRAAPAVKAATRTTVVSSVNPSIAGQPITFTATVAATAANAAIPGGTATFKAGGSAFCPDVPIVNGVAVCVHTPPDPGTIFVNVAYSGDANFAVSQSAVLFQEVN